MNASAQSDGGLPVSVLVLEDDDAMFEAFVAVVRSTEGLALWGAAGTLQAARSLLEGRPPPDVALVDLGLPDGDGTELIRELATHCPGTAVLVATVFGDESHVVRALEAGARGYLLKDSSRDELSRAVHTVHAGGAPLSPQVARHLLKRFATPAAPAGGQRQTKGLMLERLTSRESEILTLIAQGHSVAEVARLLHLSPHTVTTHVKHIYDKLAVSNRVQAVNKARATGQIQ
jgi:DNA-binding NarL/FixJ family response regulator